MSREKEICSLLFGTVDKFRDCSNNFNEYPPAKIAKVTLGQLRALKAVSSLSESADQQGIQDEHDRRAVKIRLSPTGKEIFERHFNYFISTMGELTKDIPEEELAIFEKVLSRIQDGINEIQEKCPADTASSVKEK